MDKVYIVRWKAGRLINSIYKDYEKAERVAKDLNSKRSWFHKMLADNEYVVKTFSVK